MIKSDSKENTTIKQKRITILDEDGCVIYREISGENKYKLLFGTPPEPEHGEPFLIYNYYKVVNGKTVLTINKRETKTTAYYIENGLDIKIIDKEEYERIHKWLR